MDDCVRMAGICKSYDGVPVLDHVSVSFAPGEVHALMGANGAGKSTLMNILAGIRAADAGEVTVYGEKIRGNSVREAESAGVVMIHQELHLMGDLTAAQNIFIGREPMKGIAIDDRKMDAEAAKLFAEVGLSLSPRTPVRQLSVGQRQMLEIAKALSKKTRVLILDEPTAALSLAEAEELFRIMAELKKQGICLIYISHRMDEIFRVADRITVLRDGKFVATVPASGITEDGLVRMMVGHEVERRIKEESTVAKDAPTVLDVRHLFCAATGVRDVSFTLKQGEVLGFAGLVGAGRTETMRALMAIDRKDRAKVYVRGKRVHLRSPADALRQGMCYLSEDRRRDGMLIGHSVVENTVISSVPKFTKFGLFRKKAAREAATKINERVSTKYSSPDVKIETLSGGNQQKVIFSRWMLAGADILILDEPTRGIDVGAKDEIYGVVERLTAEGKSVILISSETGELRRLCDRILVMCEGRITAELTVPEADDETILRYATKRKEEHPQ